MNNFFHALNDLVYKARWIVYPAATIILPVLIMGFYISLQDDLIETSVGKAVQVIFAEMTKVAQPTPISPTEIAELPTLRPTDIVATLIPTQVPFTATSVPAIDTIVVPTNTRIPPTPTRLPATATDYPTPTQEQPGNPHAECVRQYAQSGIDTRWEKLCKISIDVEFNGDVYAQQYDGVQVILPTFWQFYDFGFALPSTLSQDGKSIAVAMQWHRANSSWMLTQTFDTERRVCYLIKLSIGGQIRYTPDGSDIGQWKPNNYAGALFLNRGLNNAVVNRQNIEPLLTTLADPGKDSFPINQTLVWAVRSDKPDPTLYFDIGILSAFGIARDGSVLNIKNITVTAAPANYCSPGGYLEY